MTSTRKGKRLREDGRRDEGRAFGLECENAERHTDDDGKQRNEAEIGAVREGRESQRDKQ